jgi:glycerol uptake facilitator-like aquaporin
VERTDKSFGSLMYLLIVEAFFTMIIVSLVLQIKYRRAAADPTLNILTASIGVFISVSMAGPLSGAGLNPTIAIASISTGSIVFGEIAGEKLLSPIFLFPYIIGPLFGGTLAVGLQKLSDYILEYDEASDK